MKRKYQKIKNISTAKAKRILKSGGYKPTKKNIQFAKHSVRVAQQLRRAEVAVNKKHPGRYKI